MQDGEDDPWKFFAKTEKGLSEQFGVLGIGYKKANILIELVMLAQNGKATSEYRGMESTKEISKDAQEKAGQVAAVYSLYLMGALPFAEVGYMSERALKILKKRKKANTPSSTKKISISNSCHPKKA